MKNIQSGGVNGGEIGESERRVCVVLQLWALSPHDPSRLNSGCDLSTKYRGVSPSGTICRAAYRSLAALAMARPQSGRMRRSLIVGWATRASFSFARCRFDAILTSAQIPILPAERERELLPARRKKDEVKEES